MAKIKQPRRNSAGTPAERKNHNTTKGGNTKMNEEEVDMEKMREKWKKKTELMKNIGEIFTPIAQAIEATSGNISFPRDKPVIIKNICCPDDHDISNVDLQPLIKECDKRLQEIGYKIISAQQDESLLTFTMHQLDSEPLSIDEIEHHRFYSKVLSNYFDKSYPPELLGDD